MSADVALENVGLLGPKEDSFASSYYGAVDSYAAVEPNKPPASWKAIIKDLLSMGMPLAGASVCSTLLPFVSLIFVGHYSTGTTSSDEIAASGLAVMLCNVTGVSIATGLLSALDSLASQAYGRGNYPRVGIIFQRALFVVLCQAIPVIVLWQFTKPILLGLKQSQTVAELSSQYIKRLSVGFPATCGYEATRRFLQSQGISAPMFAVCLIVDALHPLWNYALIYWAHQGFLGAAWATVVSQWLLFLLLVLYIALFKPHTPGTWVPFSTEAFRGLGEFMKLGVPGAVMVCMEWWAFEIVGIAIGNIGTLQLSVHNTIYNYMMIFTSIPLGLAVASNTLVGNALGGGDSATARRAAIASFGVELSLAAVYGVGTILARYKAPLIYTSDPKVVNGVAILLPYVALFMVMDGWQLIGQGILRGAGGQSVGAVVSFVGFYVVSLPCAFSLAYAAHLGLHGMWFGMLIGYAVVGTLYLTAILRLKWQHIAELAMLTASESAPIMSNDSKDGSEFSETVELQETNVTL